MDLNLLQKSSSLVIALLVASCSEKTTEEVEYSWHENTEERINANTEESTNKGIEVKINESSEEIIENTEKETEPATTSTEKTIIQWQLSVGLYAKGHTEDFVDTTGNLEVAYNATNTAKGGSNAKVNGVTFIATDINTPLIGSSGVTVKVNSGDSTHHSYGDGQFVKNFNIHNLLAGGQFKIKDITLSQLTVGQDYLIQIFTHDERKTRNANFITGFGNGSNSFRPIGTSYLKDSATDTGHSIIGTFTAKSTSLTFNVFGTKEGLTGRFNTSNSQSQINGLQVRSSPKK